MDKVIKIIISIVLLVVSILLQLFVLNNMSLFGVRPNLFLISVIVISLNTNIYFSTVYSFILGLLVDILFGAGGMFTVSYTSIGMLLGFINEDYMKENYLSIGIITILSVSLFEIMQYIQYMIKISEYISILFLFKQLFLSILLNVILVIIICFIFGKIIKIINKKQDKIYW